MGLKDKIREDLTKAIKEKKEIICLALRQVLASVLIKEKEKRYKISKEKLTEKKIEDKSQLLDEEIIDVISNEVKKIKESILGFEKGQRMDLVEKEKKQLEILKKYLPEQFSEEEINRLIKEVIDKVRAKEIKDMGKVMTELVPKIKGKTDGSMVSKIVKEILTS